MSVLIDNFVPVAVLSASLLGSAHCAGMCGGLAVSRSASVRDGTAFHLGRLCGYLLLGAVAGLVGRSIFSPTMGAWASWIASLSMATMFFFLAYRSWYGRAPHLRWMPTRLYPRLFRDRGSALSGVFTALLPCGWLQTFVISAVATRSPLAGGIFLFAFWLGTLPALIFLPVLSQGVLRPLRHHSPRFVALLLVAAGIGSVGLRLGHAPWVGGETAAGHVCEHETAER